MTEPEAPEQSEFLREITRMHHERAESQDTNEKAMLTQKIADLIREHARAGDDWRMRRRTR